MLRCSSLSIEELQAVLCHPDGREPFSMEEAQSIVQRFDMNGDGELDYDEFVQAIGTLKKHL